MSNSKGWSEFGPKLPNLVGKWSGEKRLPWEEQVDFFRKVKWIFRRTNRR